jgi:hypothetical protein
MEDIELWFLFENPNIFLYLKFSAYDTTGSLCHLGKESAQELFFYMALSSA